MKNPQLILIVLLSLIFGKINCQNDAQFQSIISKFPSNGTYSEKKLFLINSYDAIKKKQNVTDNYYFLKSVEESLKSQNEPLLLAFNYNSLGLIYNRIGKYHEAIQNYITAEEILNLAATDKNSDEIKTIRYLIFLNRGNTYYYLDNPDKAMEYYLMSLKQLQSKSKTVRKDSINMTQSYTNIGIINGVKKNYSAALVYFRMALSLNTKLHDTSGIAHVLSNLATIHSNRNEIDSALRKRFIVKEIYELEGNKENISYVNTEISKLYLNNSQPKMALPYALRALELIDTSYYSQSLLDICDILRRIYHKMGDYKMENQYLKFYVEVMDSLKLDQKIGEINQLEMQHSFSKIHLADSIRTVEELKMKDLKISEKRTQSYFLIIVLFLSMVALGLIYSRFKLTKKQKQIIEEKNKEITDSIMYAKKIQNSILPNESYISSEMKRLNEKKKA